MSNVPIKNLPEDLLNLLPRKCVMDRFMELGLREKPVRALLFGVLYKPFFKQSGILVVTNTNMGLFTPGSNAEEAIEITKTGKFPPGAQF